MLQAALEGVTAEAADEAAPATEAMEPCRLTNGSHECGVLLTLTAETAPPVRLVAEAAPTVKPPEAEVKETTPPLVIEATAPEADPAAPDAASAGAVREAAETV